jgi:hypothetical protein
MATSSTPKKPIGRGIAKSPTSMSGKSANNKNAVEKLTQNITNRYRVTAREARDIVTAVGTTISRGLPSEFKKKIPNQSGTNLVKQIAETGRAAITGKKGTTSDIYGRRTNTGFLKGDVEMGYGYEKGKKRK